MSTGSLLTACRDSLPAIYSTNCVNKAILGQRNNDPGHISEKALHGCDMLKLKICILRTAKKKGISSANLEVIYNLFFLL
jgi:hypothetical protein